MMKGKQRGKLGRGIWSSRSARGIDEREEKLFFFILTHKQKKETASS